MSEIVTWWPARRRLATLAVGCAVLTGALVAGVGGGRDHVIHAALYSLVGVGALRVPPLVTGQLLVGLLMIAAVLLDVDVTRSLLLAPAVAGVIVTAELLAAVARLDAPIQRVPEGVGARAIARGALGGVLFSAVRLAAGAAVPGGAVSVALASAAVVGLGVVLLWAARGR